MRGAVYLVCEICGNKFEENYQLVSHKLKHSAATLKCPLFEDCEATFKHRGDQKRHGRFAHRETKDFPCDNCGKHFQSPHSCGPHLKSCNA